MTRPAVHRYPGLRKNSLSGNVILTRCPVCGHQFAPDESRADHIQYQHTPADFGLTPLREHEHEHEHEHEGESDPCA